MPVYVGNNRYMIQGHCPDWLQLRIEEVVLKAFAAYYDVTGEDVDTDPVQVIFLYPTQHAGLGYPPEPDSYWVEYPDSLWVYSHNQEQGVARTQQERIRMQELRRLAKLYYHESYSKPIAYQDPANGMPPGWYLINSGEIK